MDIEIKHLKLMMALAQTGSNLTAAAQRLHLTQSALSHQLKDAEQKMGLPLFIRKNRRLVLTPAGHQLVGLAGEVLGRLTEGVRGIQKEAEQGPKSLVMHTSCQICFAWLPAILKEYGEAYPFVEVEIDLEDDSLEQELRDGVIDIAITSDPLTEGEFITQPLFYDELVIIMPPSHPLARVEELKAKDLAGETIIIYNVSDEKSTLINDIYRPAKVSPKKVVRIELTEGIIQLVKSGLGIGIMADWLAAPHVASGELVAASLDIPILKRSWRAALRPESLKAPHIKAFVDAIRTKVVPASVI